MPETATRARSSWLDRAGTLPLACAALTTVVALYITLVAFGNVTDFGTNEEFVRQVLDMDTTFDDDDVTWRAVKSDVLQGAAYLAIIAWEILTAIVLWVAVGAWVGGHRNHDFDRARARSTVGYLMMILLFAGGFITIGGEWFAMWQSDTWNGLEPALQNFAISAFGLVLVQLPSAQWRPEGATVE